ncbi:MAG: aminotransferase class I/II-fold pyridoxal phosphate-dependent enzyme [Planctomycetes bacterium]|nr:aminotransferase class I/II-fold pyridoxal phosphate-dependent enzyme [Planctomycetota bacterium]
MKVLNEDVTEGVLAVLKSQRLFRYDCQQPLESPTAELEQAFADRIGCRYVVAMNSCSSALMTSLLSCGLRPGDGVLMPAFTFIAVPSAIVNAGGVPVLVEVTDDYVIDCDDLESKITNQTRFLLLSHMRGRVSNMDRIVKLCDRHGVILIEDCAHSLGVLWNGTQSGKSGRAAAFSAQSYKLIDAGEGGLLVTDDREVACRAMLYSGCYEDNWQKHYHDEEDAALLRTLVNGIPAFNLRMGNLSAAALLPQLQHIDARVARYNENYRHLTSLLRESAFIELPEFLPSVRPAADSVQFRILLGPAAITRFGELMAQKGIKISLLGLSEHNARCFWRWRFFDHNESCPNPRQLLMRTADMRLPLQLSDDNIRHLGVSIMETLREAAAVDASRIPEPVQSGSFQ